MDYLLAHKVTACVLSHFNHVRLFGTLWTIAQEAPLSTGFPSQESWSGLPFPTPGDLPDPGIEPECSALEVGSLPLSHQGEAPQFVELGITRRQEVLSPLGC